jgi:heptosyltransferase-2
MFERILMVRLSALGDVVLATPVLRALRAHFPAAQIDWLVESSYLDLVVGNPHLSEAVAYDKRGVHRGALGLLRLRLELQRRRYDLVIDLQAKPKTAALVRLLGAGRVVSLQKRDAPALLRAAVGRDRPLVRAHAVELYLEVLASLGIPAAGLPLELPPRAARLPRTGAAGLAPGARWATKRWSPARFAEVGNRLAARGHPVVLVGGPGDVAELDAVRAGLDAPPLLDTRALSIAQLIDTVAGFGVLVAGDSGPVHIASALGIPTVALFGPTSPQRWGPLGAQHRVVTRGLACSPCSNHGSAHCPLGTHACLREIGSEEVAAAALAALAFPAQAVAGR